VRLFCEHKRASVAGSLSQIERASGPAGRRMNDERETNGDSLSLARSLAPSPSVNLSGLCLIDAVVAIVVAVFFTVCHLIVS